MRRRRKMHIRKKEPLPQRSRGICEGDLGSKSLKVALCYETIMRRVVGLEGLPFQEQIGLAFKERVAVISAGGPEEESWQQITGLARAAVQLG